MRSGLRLAFLLIGIFGLGILYFEGSRALPPFGGGHGPYGKTINRVVVSERHVTDAVTAVNFDYRGFDTLGEEFILFASVIGAVVLLRQAEEKKRQDRDDQSSVRGRVPPPSDAVRIWTLGMTGPTVLFGLYVVTHGQLTPGGGFQGGVILATAPVLIYLAGSYDAFKRIASQRLVEAAEAVGAAGYALIGLGPVLLGYRYLQNILPLGRVGSPTSGGMMPLISLCTGLEVAGGFVLLLSAFLQEALARHGTEL